MSIFKTLFSRRKIKGLHLELHIPDPDADADADADTDTDADTDADADDKELFESRCIRHSPETLNSLEHDTEKKIRYITIQLNAAKNLNILDISNVPLYSIPDISDLANSLTEFYCYNCCLQTLPDLSKCTKLSILDCHLGKLEIIPQLPDSITKLDFSHNEVSRVCNFPHSLMKLYCNYNKLNNLDGLSKLINLLLVWCGYNCITFIPILPSIVILRCEHNSITELDLTKSTNLKRVNCSYNMISCLIVPNSLQYLYCFNTLINEGAIPNFIKIVRRKDKINRCVF